MFGGDNFILVTKNTIMLDYEGYWYGKGPGVRKNSLVKVAGHMGR